MDRRTAILAIVGVAGAGVTLRYGQSRLGAAGQPESSGLAAAMPATRQTAGPDGLGLAIAQIPIGGGGFVTGIDASADGTSFVCRTDVANAYVRKASQNAWSPLFSPRTMERSDFDPLPKLNDKADGQGVAGIRIAPSNPDVIYASYYGFIWRSEDGGRSVRRTRSPQLAMPSNTGIQRLYNRTIDVHPLRDTELIVGTYGGGALFSLDAGRKWARIDLPEAGSSLDGQPGIHLVLYDRPVGERAYVFVTGRGLYRSDQGSGGKFRLVEGGPIHASTLVQGADRVIYLTEQTKQNRGCVWRLDPNGVWSYGRLEHEATALAVDPRDPSRLIASNPNGFIMVSADGGRSWASQGGITWDRKQGEVGWTRYLDSMFPSEMIFDPSNNSRLIIAHGVGVASARARVASLEAADWSAGIEELCASQILPVPGGKLFLSAWDKSFWRVDAYGSYSNEFRYPLRQGQAHDADLVAFASYMDFAGDDPNFLVGVIAPNDRSAPGFTADGGDRWQAFAGAPEQGWGYGGCIAASTRANIVLLPSNNAVGAYTLDGGKSWQSIKLDGVTPTGGFANAYFVKRRNVTADKTRPGNFALVYTTIRNNEYAEPLGGLWLSSDGGKTWKQRFKGVVGPGDGNPLAVLARGLDARQFWQCQLDYVPGRSGELVYTPHADFAADRFYWSSDDGQSWSELHKSVRNVNCFGFGKAGAGQDRPALYFWGDVRGIKGLYGSFDWFASEPQLITRFPSSALADIACVAGDPDAFGRLYVGTSCAGWVRIDIDG